MAKNNVNKGMSMETNISKAEKALPTAMLENEMPEVVEVTEKDVKEAAIYQNGVTSIDFMMPEKERQILENNLNVYGDVEKTNKILKSATNNLKIRQGIKELEQIDKLGDIIDVGQTKLGQMLENINMSSYKNLQSTDPEAASKAVKNVAVALSSMMQVRDNKIKNLNGANSNKKVKIGIVFKNDSGETTSLGMEV